MAKKRTPLRRKTDSPARSPAMLNCSKWSDDRVFVLAAAGAAIGLNNIWLFPHLVMNNGGSAFLLVYFAALLLLGMPLMMTEILIGRRGGFSPINSVRLLIVKDACDGRWTGFGWIATFVGIIILSYLSVIAGWTIAYGLRAGSGVFTGITADGVRSMFYNFASDPEKQLFWHSLFVFMTMMISSCGFNLGMQRFIRFGVPIFFLMLGVLVLYGMGLSSPTDNFARLIRFDAGELSMDTVFAAAGHAVFSIGLGVGVLISFSSHLDESTSIAKVSAKIIGLDTLAGLMAAFLVIAILSVTEVADSVGPALVFQSVPFVLDRIPYGPFVGGLFFMMLTLAALLSAIALVEPVISWLVESWAMTRGRAAVMCGIFAWLLGLLTILSFNYWGFQTEIFGIEIHRGYFDVMQLFTSYVIIPLAILLALWFLGWGLRKEVLLEEIPFINQDNLSAAIWTLRFLLPAAVMYLFYNLYRLNL